MIITDYFDKPIKGPTFKTPVIILRSTLDTLLSNNIIDMVEHTTICNIIKSKGLLSNAHIYFNFLDKLKQKQTTEYIERFIENAKIVFSHLHNLIDNGQINKNVLVTEIEKYNDQLFILTPDQQDAVKDIAQFLYDFAVTKHGLNGLPGSGKTITITKFIHYMLANNYINNVVFAASTNKAVNVIKSKFRNDLDTLFKHKFNVAISEDGAFDEILDKLEDKGLKVHFLTIHKLLGYKNEFDSEGEKIFVRGQNNSLNKYELVIIDEISMINFSIVYNLMCSKNVKILFVGDEGQLTPVKENISVIFSHKDSDFQLSLFEEAYANNKNINFELLRTQIDNQFVIFKKEVLNLKFSTLNTVMRCNNDSVVQLCNELRKKIFDLKHIPQFFKYKSDKVHFYKYDNKTKLDTLWYKKYISYLKSNDDGKCSSLILSWTNLQTNEYNNSTRKLLFNKEVLDKFEINDILVLADFYNMKDADPKNSRFHSSEQIKVVNIEHVTKTIPLFVENLLITLKINNMNDIKEKYVRIMKVINKSTKRNYETWKLQVVKMSNIKNVSCIYVIDDKSSGALESDKKIVSDKILELINYYKSAHKEHFATIDEHIIRKLWKEFNSKFVDTFAKVNMSYAMTTHKSQGSTFHNVFIDMIDILKNFSKIDANRCLYTAISRTANEVHILY